VFVTLGPVKPTKAQLPSPIVLNHTSVDGTYSRFGWASAVLDFNNDGIDDLVVASPTHGWDWSSIAVSPDFM
jgi:hypothetical protein